MEGGWGGRVRGGGCRVGGGVGGQGGCEWRSEAFLKIKKIYFFFLGGVLGIFFFLGGGGSSQGGGG